MIRAGRAEDYNIWSHSEHMRALYRARARDEAEEMTCAAQAASILAELAEPGDSLFDAGCGSGWFFHALRKRSIPLDYWGMDKTEPFIAIAREELPAFGLAPNRLSVGEIEYAEGEADHVLCMNVLSNIDNWMRALDRLCAIARKSLVLRESVRPMSEYTLVRDRFLDPGVDLKVHVNAYARFELESFLAERGFQARWEEDWRTGGAPEDVIGYPHWWTFLVARRMEHAA